MLIRFLHQDSRSSRVLKLSNLLVFFRSGSVEHGESEREKSKILFYRALENTKRAELVVCVEALCLVGVYVT